MVADNQDIPKTPAQKQAEELMERFKTEYPSAQTFPATLKALEKKTAKIINEAEKYADK